MITEDCSPARLVLCTATKKRQSCSYIYAHWSERQKAKVNQCYKHG